MADRDVLLSSISEIGRDYRAGLLSPVEVTTLALQRIEALNPTLNAFITVTAQRALEQARTAETELSGGVDRGPLHGIPVALKDLIDVEGTPTTCGSRIRAHDHPQRSAPLAARLEAAGAVLMGKTNMLEFAYGIVHPDHGQTNNPHDPRRTAGGSSGGSAAAVAAGMCFAAVGTDTGGSIRVPAAYCGIAGLKPTYGLVDLEGVFPLSWSLDHAGPMARSSTDAGLLLEALSGREWHAPLNLKQLRLGVLTAHTQGSEMQPDVSAAFDRVCRVLEQAGAAVREVHVADLEWADAALMNIILPEASGVHAKWLKERPEDYAPLTRTQLELGLALPAVVYLRAQQYRRHLVRQFLKAFEHVDAVLSPTVAWVAPEEDPVVADDEGAAEARRTGPHNLTGFPALTINIGADAQGLPVGLQIVTPPNRDGLALSIGAAVESLATAGASCSSA